MATPVAGTAYVKVNGIQYALRGDMIVSIGRVNRESIVGLDQYHGYKEIPDISRIQMNITDKPDLDLNILETLTDQTVIFELANGKSGVLRNAAQMEKLELNVDDGIIAVRFEGPSGEWFPV